MLLTRFVHNIVEKKLFNASDRLLLAVSGGVDSIVLCDLCKSAGYNFEIAHVNFQLRAEDSVLDECFVKGVADHYRVPFHIKKFDTLAFAEQHKISVQVAARQLRYQWFYELLENDLRYVVTAHHADDNIETVLMNFFRGTGITGLRGMLEKHDDIVRPLLIASKKEILDYAKEKKLSWREDRSNASDKYSRNYFRNAVIPMVYRVFPEAEANLANNILRFREIGQLYMQAVELQKKKLLEVRGNEVHIPVLKLRKTSPLNTILFEVIKDFGFTPHQLNDVIRLLDAEQNSFVQSGTHRIIRNRNWLIIAPMENEKALNIVIEAGQHEVIFPAGRLKIENVITDHIHFSNDALVAKLDEKAMKFPLLLRKWKAGDYFYPLGMKKKKKISRFLIDHKLSRTDKEKIYVLESGRRICWVVGMRIDERFKITASSNAVLKFTIVP
ncbi:MAG TPA: tRNA lysidine(34) synthetase TilS [Flavitalea sp.]|nr:tRNA lysidine(34) synthetase TilS [Flavitalea sp.]